MDIQIGDHVKFDAYFRKEPLTCLVVGITSVDNSIYYRVVSSLYDHWIHSSKIIKSIPRKLDDANTVIRQLDDLYK